MRPEQTTIFSPRDLEELERAFEQRKENLPRGISTYIRDLKEKGRWKEAMRVNQQTRERKAQTRQKKAENELNRTVRRILETDDAQTQAVQESRAIWLLEKAGLILPEERTRELLEILDSQAPELKSRLEERLPGIRDEMKKL